MLTSIAQRYDVIITASENATASNFWIRAIPQLACSINDNPDDIRGILHYGSNTTIDTPTTTEFNYTDICVDEDASLLVPIVAKDAGTMTYNATEPIKYVTDDRGYYLWTMDNTSMVMDWNNPTLLQVYEGDENILPANISAVVNVPEANKWVYVLMETSIAAPHPMHLHGHDFLVLGTGTGTYDWSSSNLTLTNPPRRDTAVMPASGWLMVAFETDNPGAWLMHCHVGFHQVEGFAIQ